VQNLLAVQPSKMALTGQARNDVLPVSGRDDVVAVAELRELS